MAVDALRDSRLLVFGPGYVGCAVADAAAVAGIAVMGTTRSPAATQSGAITSVDFANAASAIAHATHLLSTAPPDGSGDPVLARYGDMIAAASGLQWIGYLSTTGVYGDRAGACAQIERPAARREQRQRTPGELLCLI